MTSPARQLTAALVCAATLTVGTACSSHKPLPARSIAPHPAPAFSCTDLDGHVVSRDTLQGKIVIVNFWAVWSPACAREIPELVQTRKSFGEDARRIAIVGVCLESNDLGDLRQLMEQLGVDYPVTMQDNTFADQFGGIDSIPTTFVIDPDWNIVNRYISKLQIKELRYELRYMLDEIHAAEQAARGKK
ncbi:MAG: TlpA family protein disulfide reductase [Verrucomicrobiales bacterium]|jgi:thiol-disulfide isomerase/thioredoxin|nr:TlpA family protein disulfide reductase [Verrucomicrobiales bacterium]